MGTAFEKIRKLQWMSGGGDVPSYLSTHPAIDDRVGYIQERVARLPKAVRERRSDDAAYSRVRMLIQAWYTDANSALALFSAPASPTCQERLGKAIALSRLGRVEEAGKSFAEALACNPTDTLWKREYGRYAFEFGELGEAARLLQETVLRDPDDLYALFFYARAVAEQGNHAASVSAMERVARAVPRDPEVLENLARYQAALGRGLDAHLNYAKAFAYRRQFAKYAFPMDKAEALAAGGKDRDAIGRVRSEISEYREILGI
jgi:predicted Zn-dependent protease